MTESDVINEILEIDSGFVISLGADLYLKAYNDGFCVQQYGVGNMPCYESKLVFFESFKHLKDGSKKFVSVRHELKLGLDYEALKFKGLGGE